jgi:tetratricopeptide (TPR) repeat protein
MRWKRSPRATLSRAVRHGNSASSWNRMPISDGATPSNGCSNERTSARRQRRRAHATAQLVADAFDIIQRESGITDDRAEDRRVGRWDHTVDTRGETPADDPEVAIAGCTAIIQSGHEPQKNLAKAFRNRGNAYAGKGQSDRAIEDFDQAIRLNPNNAEAFYNRGVALRALGQQARAIADFAKARQLNPNAPPP